MFVWGSISVMSISFFQTIAYLDSYIVAVLLTCIQAYMHKHIHIYGKTHAPMYIHSHIDVHTLIGPGLIYNKKSASKTYSFSFCPNASYYKGVISNILSGGSNTCERIRLAEAEEHESHVVVRACVCTYLYEKSFKFLVKGKLLISSLVMIPTSIPIIHSTFLHINIDF